MAYISVPYHNSMHAADVVQSLGCMLANDTFSDQLSDMELLSMIIAAAVHDVGHPGKLEPTLQTCLQDDLHDFLYHQTALDVHSACPDPLHLATT